MRTVVKGMLVALLVVAFGCGDDDGMFVDSGTFDAGDADLLDTSSSDGGADTSTGVDAGDTDVADTHAPDSGVDGGDSGVDSGPSTDGQERYTTDRTLSPLTARTVAAMEAIVARADDLQDDVFSKIGASATVSSSFLRCFDGDDVMLGESTHLADTVEYFGAGDAAGGDPYSRDSLCATVGWSAIRAISGSPSPLEQEIEATRPRFAIVMYGTNDINLGSITRYADNMLTLTDELADRGVIPILTSIMARGDSAAADANVPRYNLVVRAIAQARQVPFIDYHREMERLPDRGLSGDDIHPSVHRDGGRARGCWLTEEGLDHGYNMRNLLTMETLDRVRAAVLEGDVPPDVPGPPNAEGDGSKAMPFVIEGLPYTHVANTLFSTHRDIDDYPGCMATQDESGPELVYELVLTEETNVRIGVFDRGDVDVDVHLLDAPMSGGAPTNGETCLARDHTDVTERLPAGTYYIVVDTFVSAAAGAERSGEYLLTVAAE